MTNTEMNLCFISGKSLDEDDTVVVKVKGGQAPFQSSKKRDNRKQMRLFKIIFSVISIRIFKNTTITRNNH